MKFNDELWVSYQCDWDLFSSELLLQIVESVVMSVFFLFSSIAFHHYHSSMFNCAHHLLSCAGGVAS